MSSPGWVTERVQAIDKRIAELKLIREQIIQMKKDFKNEQKQTDL
tara:strand:+ start:212 stop:346 length:135 start_codon:yes stop_codon:yes gene_type:complete